MLYNKDAMARLKFTPIKFSHSSFPTPEEMYFNLAIIQQVNK